MRAATYLVVAAFAVSCSDERGTARPSSPVDFSVVPEAEGALLAWRYPDGISVRGALVFWGQDGSLDEQAFIRAPATSYRVQGLEGGAAYSFAVALESSDGRRSLPTLPWEVVVQARDETAPTIVSTTPTNGADTVLPDALIAITFDEPMDPESVQLTLSPSRELNPPQWDAWRTTLVVAPVAGLREGTTYSVTVAGTDVAGLELAGTRTFSFSVVNRLGTDEVQLSPPDGAADVPTDSRIVLRFDEPMNETSVLEGTTIAPSTSCTWEVSKDLTEFACKPTSPLVADQSYTVTLGTSVVNQEGVSLPEPIGTVFSTVSGTDTTAPALVSVDPEDDAVGVLPHFTMTFTFSEPMDPVWTQAALTFPSHPGLTGTFRWSDGDRVMTFEPDEDPDHGTPVSWALSSQARDRSGNAVGVGSSGSFTVARLFWTRIVATPWLDGVVFLRGDGVDEVNTDGTVIPIGSGRTYDGGETLARGFLSFWIAFLDNVLGIRYASLNFYALSRYPRACDQLGGLWVDRVVYGESLEVEDHDLPIETRQDCSTIPCVDRPDTVSFPCPPESYWDGFWYIANVTSILQDQFVNRRANPRSQWRLRAEHEVLGESTLYRLSSADTEGIDPDHVPYLYVEYYAR